MKWTAERTLTLISALIMFGFGAWLFAVPSALAGIGIALDGPHSEAHKVKLIGSHDAWMLSHLAADECTARLGTPVGDTGHQGLGGDRVETTDGQIVQEEKRSGACANEVVHAHGHQVATNGVKPTGLARDLGLSTHPVGGRHQ